LCLTYIDCKKGRKGTKKKERTKNTLNKEKIEKTRIKTLNIFFIALKQLFYFIYLFLNSELFRPA
jgi:1,4-dihydroxy-2-naphthoate octaprenyltransferase